MKTKQLRELTEQELEQQLRDSMDALVNLRMQAATSELENNQAIRRVRRDISKVKTLLREAELKRERESGREG
jgi:large subunit ribosomal protein L29